MTPRRRLVFQTFARLTLLYASALMLTMCASTSHIPTEIAMQFPSHRVTNAPILFEDKIMRVRSLDCQQGNLLRLEGQNFRPTTPDRSMFVVTLLFESPHPKGFLVSAQTIFAQYDNIDPDFVGAPPGKPGLRPPEMIILLDSEGRERLPHAKFDTDEFVGPNGFLARRYVWSFPKPLSPNILVLNVSFTPYIMEDLVKLIPMSRVCSSNRQ